MHLPSQIDSFSYSPHLIHYAYSHRLSRPVRQIKNNASDCFLTSLFFPSDRTESVQDPMSYSRSLSPGSYISSLSF